MKSIILLALFSLCLFNIPTLIYVYDYFIEFLEWVLSFNVSINNHTLTTSIITKIFIIGFTLIPLVYILKFIVKLMLDM